MLTIPLIIFIFPIISIILGGVGYLIFKNLSAPIILVILLGIIAAIVWFNRSFGFWIFIYGFLAFAGAFLTKMVTTKMKSRKPLS
ncbi:DUF2651 family protein [Gracilibacillus suaedae]|uniref:DUF2651 family protein n=1 Tax=Gracilibacillus suaedae TaxID=2820273 RepID=UPI001ABDB768|nr:DUF2651 family protein [Gracilibacillus suaedae]